KTCWNRSSATSKTNSTKKTKRPSSAPERTVGAPWARRKSRISTKPSTSSCPTRTPIRSMAGWRPNWGTSPGAANASNATGWPSPWWGPTASGRAGCTSNGWIRRRPLRNMPPEQTPAARPQTPAAHHAWRRRLTALLAGGLQALCFAPGPLPAWSLPFVQIATLAVLAALTFQAAGPRRAAALGWLFGLAQFGIGVYWLTISMHTYGGLSLPLAIAALLLFAAAMAAYTAGACALAAWLCAGHGHPQRRAPRQILNAVAWASAWTLAEWLRGTLFTGFTWLNAGYAHAEGMFAAWAPFTGVYGLAWLAAFAAAAAALMIRAKDTAYDRSAAAVVGLALSTGLMGIA